MRRLVPILIAVAAALPGAAATLERLTLDEMIQQSTAIVRGRVSAAGSLQRGPLIYSRWRIQVAERWKGPAGSEAEVLTAARALQAQGVGEVLVKLGARGVLLVQRDGTVLRQDAFRVSVVDTTGAGDCCTAAYAVAWAEGRAPQERLRFACVAAGLCVQAKGAMPAMPARAAVDAFLRERA